MNEPYIVYAKPNANGYITSVNSSEFLADTTGWVEIDHGYGDKYHHAMGNYFPKPIQTDGGAYRYKLMDGKAVECTEKEIKEQEDPYPVAPRNITAGEYINIDGALYKVTANIPRGGFVITGQNAVATTIESQLYELAKGE